MFAFRYDMTQGNKNVKLVRVTDPRGHATNLDYYSRPEDDPKFKWSTKTYTDRLNSPTQFAYTDPDGQAGSQIQTVVTDAENHGTTYLIDGFGRPTDITNAKSQVTKLAWDADNNVTRLEEDNHAFSTWTYDAKTGYPLTIKGAEANAHGTPGTTLTYQTQLDGHIADLATKQSPEGRTWTFGYNLEGDLATVTDPLGTSTPAAGDYTTTYVYDTWGQMQSATDANGRTTRYPVYDSVGYPKTIDNSTTFIYDLRGNVTSLTDANIKTTTQAYDVFKRPGEKRQPLDTSAIPPVYIITPAPEYDANDNVTKNTAPNGAVTTSVFDDADRIISGSLPKDTPTGPDRIASFTYDKVGNLLTETEPRGNLTPADPNDFVHRYGYDEIYQLTSVTDPRGGVSTSGYDNVGNLILEVDPRKNATPDPTDYTAKYTYDLNHRKRSVVDPLGYTSWFEYDLDGKVVGTIDPDGNKSTTTLDKRGFVFEVKAPHKNDGGTITYRTTRYEYDQMGNRTKVITPRGVDTPTVADDFVQQTVYDELNRVKEQLTAFDPNDSRYNTPDKTTYAYDKVGNLDTVSAPPSQGQTVSNETKYAYFDNGWTKSSTDAWDIATTYRYDELGNQTSRTVTSAGESSASRKQTWTYFPDGKLASRSDDGVPVGRHLVVVDNSDTQNVTTVGTWPASSAGQKFQGYDYRSNAAGTGADTFTWKLVTPAAGTYQVFVKYPSGVSGAATNAPYTVSHAGGSTTTAVNQTQQGGDWISIGSYTFTKGISHSIRLSDNANGTVLADAVKLVRDNSGDVDNEKKTFSYTYDVNGNQTTVADASPAPKVDAYAMTYDVLNRLSLVEERKNGALLNSTSYTFDPNSNPLTYVHDRARGTFEYDTRGLISKVTNATSATDPNPKVTTFGYTSRAEMQKITKANGNTVDLTYYLDGLVRTQVEKKAGGTVVADHSLEYTANSDVAKDTARVMNADNHSAYLNNLYTYTYDPRDRIAKVAKTGDTATTETYFHDANSNVYEQTVGSLTTKFGYDRNRLQSAEAVGGLTSTYNYDPWGRLDTVMTAGTVAEDYTYDGFDRTTEHRTPSATTRYVYDPFDRTVSRTEKAGTPNAKTTNLLYLGLDSEVFAEETPTGQVKELYAYGGVGGVGQRLSKVKTKDDGTKEHSYYTYHPLGDVEALTNQDGNTRDTYGYTAYGKDDNQQFTGADKPDPANPDKEQDNVYRFNAKRWDAAAGTYDMGFRDYDPGLNRFLTRDLYNGALADMSLIADPFTGNRYAFGGGNPISFVEIDGHWGFSFSDIGHAVLDVAGLVPVVGEVADVANGIWYAAEGNYVDAALSFASAIPLAGYGASAAKAVRYGDKAVDAARTVARQGDNIADAGRTIARTGDDIADARRAAPSPKDTPTTKPAGGTPPKAQPAPVPKPKPAPAPSPSPTPSKAGRDGPSCPINSFTPDTPVLMADGSHKAIAKVKVGDQVVATDPRTGRTEARPVAALIIGEGDKNIVEITFDTDGDRGNRTGTVVATDGHPFWVDDFGGWIDAADLKPGDIARTPDGQLLTVVRAHGYTAHRRVHNLTIDGIHTYYVTAGDRDILVHNKCGDADDGAPQVLRDGEGATPEQMANSVGGPTGGSRVGQAEVRQHLLDQAGGTYTCWRCGMESTNPANMHLGHRNVPTSRGGNLHADNVCLEGAACNLSAGARGGPSPGMSCVERGGCGAPYGRFD